MNLVIKNRISLERIKAYEQVLSPCLASLYILCIINTSETKMSPHGTGAVSRKQQVTDSTVTSDNQDVRHKGSYSNSTLLATKMETMQCGEKNSICEQVKGKKELKNRRSEVKTGFRQKESEWEGRSNAKEQIGYKVKEPRHILSWASLLSLVSHLPLIFFTPVRTVWYLLITNQHRANRTQPQRMQRKRLIWCRKWKLSREVSQKLWRHG